MKRLTLLAATVVFLFMHQGHTQTSVQQEIDRDVWRPFEQTYASMEADAFLALHDPDAIRVIRDSKAIREGDDYHLTIRKSMATDRERGGRRTIELRFTERFADGELAFDSGFYKVVVWYSDDESYVFYGQFEVILRKIDDRWKILVDADSSQGGTLTEQDFHKGKRVGEY